MSAPGHNEPSRLQIRRPWRALYSIAVGKREKGKPLAFPLRQQATMPVIRSVAPLLATALRKPASMGNGSCAGHVGLRPFQGQQFLSIDRHVARRLNPK